MQADYYPIPPIPANWYSGTGFRGVKIFVDNWRKASDRKKPFWFVCQAFDYSLLKQDKYDIPPEWQRFPTLRELRTMTYVAIASGARGIFYWSLSRLRNARENADVTAEDHWERLATVTAELNKLMPLLTADTAEKIVQQDRVVAMIKGDGQETFIIAANYERRPTDTALQIPNVDDATAQIMFTGGELTITDGKLPLQLEPLESRICRIEGTQEETSMTTNEGQQTATATFGAGCFWGVEASFKKVPGVVDTEVGFMGGDVENPSYEQVCTNETGHAEVVQVKYDAEALSYEELLDVFWRIHDPTQVNRQGPDVGLQYRSVIFYHTPEQKRAAEKAKQALQDSADFEGQIATRIAPAEEFYPAEDYHQDYFEK